MTKWQLFLLLAERSPGEGGCLIPSTDGRRYRGILESIQREDGSGSSFNVTMTVIGGLGRKSERKTFHVRTID